MEKFHIGCWTYFPFSKAWDSLAKDYHDLGFTNPMTPVFRDGDDPQAMLKLLDQFHQLGMQVILYDDRITAHTCIAMEEETYRRRFSKSLEQFGFHPAVMGFYVGDEPDAPYASAFFKIARIQREMAGHLTPFLNLLPWFDWIGERIGSPAYAPYLDRAVKEGNLALLSYDCYTQMWEGDSGYDVYFDNLKEMRDASERHHIPFCTTVLSSGHYDYACPNQDDFRWQISTAAALGAKAIYYFYVAGIEPSDNYRHFPINTFGERSESFCWLSEENRFFLTRYSEALMKLTCYKSEFTKKAYGGLSLFAPDETLLDAKNNKDINILISSFTDADGFRYRAVVNMDRTRNIEAKLTFASSVKIEKLSWNNRWETSAGYQDAVGALSKDGSTLSMWMAPGQLELLREIPL